MHVNNNESLSTGAKGNKKCGGAEDRTLDHFNVLCVANEG
jgi:hypothetical protein